MRAKVAESTASMLDRDPAKPGARERSCHLGQKMSVGGDGRSNGSPAGGAQLGKLLPMRR